jgi:hypothetical protein
MSVFQNYFHQYLSPERKQMYIMRQLLTPANTSRGTEAKDIGLYPRFVSNRKLPHPRPTLRSRITPYWRQAWEAFQI